MSEPNLSTNIDQFIEQSIELVKKRKKPRINILIKQKEKIIFILFLFFSLGS